MNIFEDFPRIAAALQHHQIHYALCGGVAMAFHSYVRFTKDIDILVERGSLGRLVPILESLSYEESAPAWTFREGHYSLHRFARVEDDQVLFIDVLEALSPEAIQVIESTEIQIDPDGTKIPIASKTSLIWMKRQRNSEQDILDIQHLENK